jgi:hypothetical protein
MRSPSAFPLAWPPGWRRVMASRRKPAQFTTAVTRQSVAGPFSARTNITLADARKRLADELERINAGDLDGHPRAGDTPPADPGVAVYFRIGVQPRVLACDKWDTVAGNVAAIAAHIKAMRDQERWGVGSLEQAFRGYAALPAPDMGWVETLGRPQTVQDAEASYCAQMRTAHPDAGGDPALAARLNAAIVAARDHFIRQVGR